MGQQNISSLTREVQLKQSNGSRVTIKKKLLELGDEELVEKAEIHNFKLVE